MFAERYFSKSFVDEYTHLLAGLLQVKIQGLFLFLQGDFLLNGRQFHLSKVIPVLSIPQHTLKIFSPLNCSKDLFAFRDSA